MIAMSDPIRPDRYSKRGKRTFTSKPREEMIPESGFSYVDPPTGIRFSFSLVENGQGDKYWSASATRTVNGEKKSVTVYAGTENTMLQRWDETVQSCRRKAIDAGFLADDGG